MFSSTGDVYGDFVNLEDLPAQSSKMLIGVWFAYICSKECEYAYVVSVLVVL